MEQVKLERLFMEEVSGVDDPANQLPGWMVQKSVGDPYLLLAQEMESITKAAASKEPYGDVTYADPGYQKDGKKRYPLDTEEHVRAAWSYINQEGNADIYTAEQLSSIKAKITAAMKKLGATVEDDAKKTTRSEQIVATIKTALGLGDAPDKENDVEKAEFVEALEANNESLAKAVAEAVSKSLTPAEGEGAATETTTEAPAAEATTAVDVEALTKAAVEAAVEEVAKQYNEILEKVLDRIAVIEEHAGIAARKSIDGQETEVDANGEPVAKSTPNLGDAILGAFARGR